MEFKPCIDPNSANIKNKADANNVIEQFKCTINTTN